MTGLDRLNKALESSKFTVDDGEFAKFMDAADPLKDVKSNFKIPLMKEMHGSTFYYFINRNTNKSIPCSGHLNRKRRRRVHLYGRQLTRSANYPGERENR